MKCFALFALSAMAFMLASCGPGSQPSPPNRQDSSAIVLASAKANSGERLLAAAEPFEKLTEIAFTAPLAEIDKTIVDARNAAASIRPLLSPSSVSGADKMFLSIDRARRGEDRAGLALASIEIYRGIVSSVAPETKVPATVSLLDYAGFRYQADLKAVPIRWTDMSEAMIYARSQWSELAPQLKNSALSASFERALVNMEKSVADKNVALAATSASEELNLVDELELHFSR